MPSSKSGLPEKKNDFHLNFKVSDMMRQPISAQNAYHANNKNIEFYAGFTLKAKHDPICDMNELFSKHFLVACSPKNC